MSDTMTLWEQLKATGSFIKGTLFDHVIVKKNITTPLGSDFLEVQVRETSKSAERYLLLKSRGGDINVYVPLDASAAGELVDFIEQSFLHRKTR
jgi:hypothetical protein